MPCAITQHGNNKMPKFEKDQMLEELSTILLFEADHILMGAGAAAAESFIGFRPSENGDYCFEDPKKVDLSRFNIAGSFDRGYDYAFNPSVDNDINENEVQDLNVFMLGTPRAGGIASGGETHRFMTPDGLCQTVSDTVFARWRLEWLDNGGDVFTTRELALLANMSEGAVRNALADKSDSGLRSVPGAKNPIVVEKGEALRWLLGRRGFVPMPERALFDRFLHEHLRDLDSSLALGRLIRRRILSVFGNQEKAATDLNWPPERIADWIEGRQTFDVSEAEYLALRLDLDAPLFTGKSLEVVMRRDRTETGVAKS